MNGKPNYDFVKRKQVTVRAVLRGAVSLYLLYLAEKLVSDASSQSTLPAWAGWMAGSVFALVGVLFGIFTWRQYRQGLKDAELPDEPEEPDAP